MKRMTVFYAIGDIHGEFERLVELHGRIHDYHIAFHAGARRVLVHLGDYVDRGPDSASVVDYLMRLEGEDCVCLQGNHEVMMVGAHEGYRVDWWRGHGGAQTMESYADYPGARPPKGHIDWLRGLPNWWHCEEERLVFVHAMIDPDSFPAVRDPALHLWGRQERFFDSGQWINPALDNYRVLHGHTPTEDGKPETSSDGRRINVDTGACYGGPLSAAIIAPNERVQFLSI